MSTKEDQIRRLKTVVNDMVDDAARMKNMSQHDLEIQLARTMAAVCGVAAILVEHLEGSDVVLEGRQVGFKKEPWDASW